MSRKRGCLFLTAVLALLMVLSGCRTPSDGSVSGTGGKTEPTGSFPREGETSFGTGESRPENSDSGSATAFFTEPKKSERGTTTVGETTSVSGTLPVLGATSATEKATGTTAGTTQSTTKEEATQTTRTPPDKNGDGWVDGWYRPAS